METLAAQPSVEQKRSFDPLASVDLLRFDIERFGYVLPETRQRVYDEELSGIAEGIERASRTEFVLPKEGNDLMYFDRGQWRSYTGMLLTGQKIAHQEAIQDTRRAFLADWADRDLEIGYRLRAMQPGDVMSWTNGYPHEQERLSGGAFLQSCGLQPRRKMGFIYRAECLDDGNVVLQSQTVDGSHAAGFAAVDAHYTDNPDAGLDDLVSAYDEAATRDTGEQVYAGRTKAIREENVWHDILKHQDLIEAMFAGLESIASQNVPRSEICRQTERVIIGTWKAFKLRLDADAGRQMIARRSQAPAVIRAMNEIESAYGLAKSQGDIKILCGGALSVTGETEEVTDLQATFDAIFGEKSSGESRGSWKWKEGVCRVESCPTRPGKTKVGPCEVCVRCQAKFDAGFDPTKAGSRVTTEAAASKPDLYSLFMKEIKKAAAKRKSDDKAELGLAA